MEHYRGGNKLTGEQCIFTKIDGNYFLDDVYIDLENNDDYYIDPIKCNAKGVRLEVSTSSMAYKHCKKKKCLICETTEDLTVHHSVPKDIYLAYGIKTYPIKDLVTLCDSCHSEYTEEENAIKKEMTDLTCPPVYQSIEMKISTFKGSAENTQNRSMKDFNLFFRRDFKNFEEVVECYNKNFKRVSYTEKTSFGKLCKLWKNHFKVWKMKKEILSEIKESL